MADYEFSVTNWKNHTSQDVRFEIFMDSGKIMKVHVPAGGTKALPSEYDQGIRTVRNGVVVGGLAPQLVPDGERERVPLHEAIAKAAAQGDLEREILRTTGFAPGSSEVTALTAMQAQIAKLEKQLAEGAGSARAAEEARKATEEARAAKERAEQEARAAKEQADAAAAAQRAKDAEIEALRRQLEELQTAPEPKTQGGARGK
ncbi:hypothetical protein [Sorangium sp. So ce233]|uniref:hypothetical protein n=1 Tax=Sorangium sp. So ce233 TaxID=3133290 RepID=UPI003F62B14D